VEKIVSDYLTLEDQLLCSQPLMIWISTR